MPTEVVQKEDVKVTAEAPETAKPEDAKVEVKATAEGEDTKRKPSTFSKPHHEMTKAEKFTKSVNVRLNNYTHSTHMAVFIAGATFLGFILLLVSMADNCPIEESEEAKTVYTTGIKSMQREFVNRIMEPDNLKELKAAGVTRTAEICMNRAGMYKISTEVNSPTNGYLVLVPCALPNDAGFALDNWKGLKWCKGMEALNNRPPANPMAGPQGDEDAYCTTGDDDMRSFTTHVTYKIKTSKKVCPSAASVIGSGLAYISYIEMIATFVIGFFLIKAGFAKPLNDRASIMGLMKSANSDTSKVEDAIDTLRADVDEMMHGQNDLDDEQTKQIEALQKSVEALEAKQAEE